MNQQIVFGIVFPAYKFFCVLYRQETCDRV